jgi:hypothetical protein
MKLIYRSRTILTILMAIKTQYIFSQEKIIWTSVSTPLRFSQKLQAPIDFSYRTLGFTTSAYQYTFRGGVRWNFTPSWSTSAGIARFLTRNSFKTSDEVFVPEFRVWQDVVSEKKLRHQFTLQNRLRIEERFFDATSESAKYTAIRLRYRIGVVKLLHEKYKVQLAEEYMEHYSFDRFSFQQNRVYVSGGLFLDALTQIEAGYILSRIPGITRHYITFSFQRIIVFHANRNR